MPDTTSPPGSPEPQSKAGKGRLVIVAGLCLGLALGGYLIGGRMSDGSPAEAADDTVAEEPEPTVGEIVDLEPLNVNLDAGHYLRIAVSLGLPEAHGAVAPAEGHAVEPEGEEGSGFPTAPAADLVLTTFAGRPMESLATAPGREQARQDLLAGIRQYYGEETVLTVFFTEFVMQ